MQNNGEWLMTVEQGNDHVISVWDWQEDRVYTKSNVSPTPRLSLHRTDCPQKLTIEFSASITFTILN